MYCNYRSSVLPWPQAVAQMLEAAELRPAVVSDNIIAALAGMFATARTSQGTASHRVTDGCLLLSLLQRRLQGTRAGHADAVPRGHNEGT